MGRPKHQEWEYFEMTGEGIMCKFCKKVLKGNPSISRLKIHLSRLPNGDIQHCEKVPNDVEEKVLAAIREKEAPLTAIQRTKKRRKAMASSSGNRIHDPLSTSPQQQTDYEVVNHGMDDELSLNQWMQTGVLETEQPVSTSPQQQIDNEVEDQVMDDVHTVNEWVQIGASEKEQPVGDERTSCCAEVPNHLENDPGHAMQLVQTKGYELPTAELFGAKFERYMEDICGWLMEKNVSMVGIYGMVGVGKTELAKHINNKLLASNTFHCVCWVVVSPDFSIWKLQNSIAEVVGVDLSSVNDENIRAAKLSEALIKNKKSVFILDDVWNYIPLNKVGFPVGMKRCKFVLTTCSLDVCRQMQCLKNVKVEPFREQDKDAWELFKKELGQVTVLSQEAERIAKSAVEECGGLPLGIETMARYLRGVDDIIKWKNEGGIQRTENAELFLKLRRIYNNLNDPALQQCFLYCALFPSNYNIQRGTLIDYLIVEGIIKGKRSREEEFDEGHHMLNRLQDLCLLENNGFGNEVDMHMLIRQMALQIMKESLQFIVVSGKEKVLPDEEYWTEDLVRVSLVNNDIEEIPANHSPRCPNLLTLLLNANYNLRSLPDCFFKQLQMLKVLDLSFSDIENIPSSISDLANLGALLLRCCNELRQGPSLAKLRKLKKLDLNYSGIEEVPQGIELLSNLRYLGLIGTKLKVVAPEIFNKLSRLQVLMVDPSLFAFKVEEIACLRKLETLICEFHDDYKYDVDKFNNLVSSLKLSNYSLSVGKHYEWDELYKKEYILGYARELLLYKCSKSSGKDAFVLPGDVEYLSIESCDAGRRFMLEKAIKLENLTIVSCDGIELMLSFFPAESIKDGRDGERTIQPLPPAVPWASRNTFSHLKKIVIHDNSSLKKLFPYWLLSNLQNLEEISLEHCDNLEEIIVSQNCNSIYPATQVQSFYLPKLRSVELINLPELKSICSIKLICDSLQYLKVGNCEKLKLIAFDLLSLNNNQPSHLPSLKEIWFYPKECWDGLQWMLPNTSIVLLPLCRFEEFS